METIKKEFEIDEEIIVQFLYYTDVAFSSCCFVPFYLQLLMSNFSFDRPMLFAR